MKCQSHRISKLISSIMLIIGVLVGVCTKFLSHNTAFNVDYLYGISCGLITASIAVLVISFIRSKNPKYAKQDQINEQDERNQLIAMRSSSVAYNFIFYGVTLLFIIDLFIPLSFHFVGLFLILLTAAIQLIVAQYYSKKL